MLFRLIPPAAKIPAVDLTHKGWLYSLTSKSDNIIAKKYLDNQLENLYIHVNLKSKISLKNF